MLGIIYLASTLPVFFDKLQTAFFWYGHKKDTDTTFLRSPRYSLGLQGPVCSQSAKIMPVSDRYEH